MSEDTNNSDILQDVQKFLESKKENLNTSVRVELQQGSIAALQVAMEARKPAHDAILEQELVNLQTKLETTNSPQDKAVVIEKEMTLHEADLLNDVLIANMEEHKAIGRDGVLREELERIYSPQQAQKIASEIPLARFQATAGAFVDLNKQIAKKATPRPAYIKLFGPSVGQR